MDTTRKSMKLQDGHPLKSRYHANHSRSMVLRRSHHHHGPRYSRQNSSNGIDIISSLLKTVASSDEEKLSKLMSCEPGRREGDEERDKDAISDDRGVEGLWKAIEDQRQDHAQQFAEIRDMIIRISLNARDRQQDDGEDHTVGFFRGRKAVKNVMRPPPRFGKMTRMIPTTRRKTTVAQSRSEC